MNLKLHIHKQSDEALMLAFQHGSHDAFNELYARYAQKLLVFMFRILQHNEAIAQDTLHDVFAMIIENPKKFNAQKSFKPWIYTVAANACKKHHRNKPTENIEQAYLSIGDEDNAFIEKLDSVDFNRALRTELDQMKTEHSCTFILRYQEHLSLKEISQIMDCPEGTVKSRLHYSLKILSQRLAIFHPHYIPQK